MVYTDLQTLRGLGKPVDYGSGVEYADGILESLFAEQHVGLQIGLWLNGTAGCNDIISGALDANVQTLLQYLSTSKASQIFLRVGYEFDNPSFGYSDDPGSYKRAFVILVLACRRRSACYDKVQFVWHSWAARREGVLEDYYPGDQYVDWIGVSIFDHFFPWSKGEGRPEDIMEVLEFAKVRGKPTMIAESTPFGGIDLDVEITRQYDLMDPWDRWFQPILDLIDDYDISMWSYINCDWESQPMWHKIGFGETRLSTNTHVMKKWRDKVLHGERHFLTAGSLEECAGPHSDPTQGLLGASLVDMSAFGPTGADVRFDSVIALLLVATCCVALYFWRRERIPPRQEIEKLREAHELIHLLKYGSTSSLCSTVAPT
jgi:hypothetical protein